MNKEQKPWRPGDAYEPLQVIEVEKERVTLQDVVDAVVYFLVDWAPLLVAIVGFGLLLTGCAARPRADIYKQCWISKHDGFQRCQCRGDNGRWEVCP